ncbi:MAG TPA: flagellin [Rhizomicrobium sp.]|jgi:flagellar hook-associated protein 3 FlgL
MTIDRVSTNSQSQFLLNQIDRANSALAQTQDQVTSGNVADNYAGYGSQVSIMEAARSAGARVTAYQAATTQASTQTDLQNTQIGSLADLATQLRQTLTTAVANNDGTTLMTEVNSIFQSASQVLNAQDANGNYIYGGGNDSTPPFTATSLSDLATMPSVSDAFANGTQKTSVAVGDGQTVQIGQLASDMGTGLMSTLADIANYVSSNGSLGNTLTGAQSDYLTSQIGTSATVATNLNNVLAANGAAYNQLQDASDNQASLATMYTGFVSDIQNVDMPTAITQLNQNQVALQAALQVTSQLQNVSLLNYLPAA